MSDRISPAQSNRLVALDALRGCAAFAVVLFHLGRRNPALMLAPHGYLAVDLFFGLSGLVIARAYDERLRQGLRLPGFLGARLRRLYPLYLIGLVLGVLAHLVARPEMRDAPAALGAALVGGLLITPVVVFAVNFPMNRPSWSLFCELAVNVLHGAFARHLSTKRLAGFVGVSGAALVFCAWRNGGLDGGDLSKTLAIGLVRAGFSYAVGLLVHRLHVAQRLPASPWFLPLSLAALFAVMATPLAGAWNAFVDVALVALVCPLILILAVHAHVARGRGLCGAVGALSYPVYIMHDPAIIATQHWVGGSDAGLSLATGLPAVFLTAVMAMRCEAPLRRLFERAALQAGLAASGPARPPARERTRWSLPDRG